MVGLQKRVAELEAERKQNLRMAAVSSSDQPDSEAELHRRLRAAGHQITGDGRISEASVAWLPGQSVDTVRYRRRYGNGPTPFRLGTNRARVTYRLSEVVQWLDSLREVG